jgi:flagellum-specific ATP synthase
MLGRVERVRGLLIEAKGPRAAYGDLCRIEAAGGDILAEVVGFRGATTVLMALTDVHHLAPDALVRAMGHPLRIAVSDELVGRVLNGLGDCIDGGPPLKNPQYRMLTNDPPPALKRNRVTKPMSVGIRAIDGLLTLGEGQRVGIFAGSGVGKSVLLGMMARFSAADVAVVGLIGERGREVRDFIEKYLGTDGMKKAVVVTETSDSWPLRRIKAAMTATTIAEHFRDQGKRVLLMMDSVTRIAHAMREVGLSVGEPPATRGYPPSVFALMPKLLERAGNSERGSITALYTVLVDGDDMNEPVADTVRSILDGHIVLSRSIAARNHYPAVDVLRSVSRVMPDVTSSEQRTAAAQVKEWLAAYADAEDLITVGAYAKGSSPLIDQAVQRLPQIQKFLKQDMDEHSTHEQAEAGLAALTTAA